VLHVRLTLAWVYDTRTAPQRNATQVRNASGVNDWPLMVDGLNVTA